jgi:nickel/cobalt transporter (NicO) family protein
MWILAFTAAFVGFFHSIVPGHWIPIVLTVRTRQWTAGRAAVAALVTSLGHVVTSVGIGLSTFFIGAGFLHEHSHELEEKAGWIMVAFGLGYALFSLRRHQHCHGHEHHGPDPRGKSNPFLFLFTVGLSPCFAILPVYATAVTYGAWILLFCMVAYSLGVIVSMLFSTLLVSRGMLKLDLPILEHHGDLITGLAVAAMGAVLLLFPHQHGHL